MPGFPTVGSTLGNFELLERVGGGGMGVVFKARQRSTGRIVAVKVIAPQFASDPEYRVRFAREAASMARVESPYVVGIVDHGEVDECLFLASQFVEGPDLGAYLAAQGPLPLPDALAVCQQLAEGLADAHAAGVLHRDIKPANVLLRDRGGRWHAFLCDLGVASVEGAEVTRTGTMVGTTGYLAPERIDGAPASPASDVYALGCLLVAALTGTAPYVGSEFVVMQAHRTQPVPQWAETDPSLVRLNAVVRRAMAKDPGQRFGSAAEFGAALAGVLAEGASGPAPVAAAATVLRANTAPDAPLPAQPPPAQPSTRAGTVWAPLIGALVALLVLATGATAYLLGHRGNDSDQPEAASASESATAHTDARTGTTPPDPQASSSAPQVTISCWYGTRVVDARECRPVTGLAGLRWVFPSLDAQLDAGACRPASLRDSDGSPKTDAYQCRVALDGGGTGWIYYSAYKSADILANHYAGKYGAPTQVGSFDRFGPADVHGTGGPVSFQTTYAYAHPRRWAATAASNTSARALATLAHVRMRPYRDLCHHIACTD